jgi:hypothetical protein
MATTKWVRVQTSIPPGMKRLLVEESADSTQALIIRTALIRYLGWDVKVHEAEAFLGYDPEADSGKDEERSRRRKR